MLHSTRPNLNNPRMNSRYAAEKAADSALPASSKTAAAAQHVPPLSNISGYLVLQKFLQQHHLRTYFLLSTFFTAANVMQASERATSSHCLTCAHPYFLHKCCMPHFSVLAIHCLYSACKMQTYSGATVGNGPTQSTEKEGVPLA